MFVYAPDTIQAALDLAASGYSNKRIARTLGVSRDSVRRWRSGDIPGRAPRSARSLAPALDRLDPSAYAHLLGLYLGDGCISKLTRTFSLRITLDARYPGIVAGAASSMQTIRGDGVVSFVPAPGASWSEAIGRRGRSFFRSTARVVSTGESSSWRIGSVA
jgi:hypothetical protein